MKKFALLVTMITTALMLASGIALGDTADCTADVDCYGTSRDDTLSGSSGDDSMFGKGGNDIMRGNLGADAITGQTGVDRIYGGPGNDGTIKRLLWGGNFNPRTQTYNDRDNDYVYGGSGDDNILGGFALDGVDRLRGNKGDDTIDVAQEDEIPYYRFEVTKEIVDCGEGTDTVYYDEGLDVVSNCENMFPRSRY